MIQKKEALNLVLQELEQEHQIIYKASKNALEAATHEENKPEDQWDTRGIEASYLAGAQSQRALELENMIKALRNFPCLDFEKKERIQLGALIEIKQEKDSFWAFLLPYGAGISVLGSGKKISVITPASPMGKELMNKKRGDAFEISSRGNAKEYEIIQFL